MKTADLVNGGSDQTMRSRLQTMTTRLGKISIYGATVLIRLFLQGLLILVSPLYRLFCLVDTSRLQLRRFQGDQVKTLSETDKVRLISEVLLQTLSAL
jgi:hypothetical protein